MKRCTYCGKEHDDGATICVVDREPLVQVILGSQGRKIEPRVDFIRLFFRMPEQEEFAVSTAGRIAETVGDRITLLRPNTTWAEIFGWGGTNEFQKVTFAVALSMEMGEDFKQVMANPESMTFRDFVEDACTNKN